MPGQSTHDVAVGATTVTKRYVAWDRGEPDRELAALEVLAVHAPGLAPAPVALETVEGVPVLRMSRVPGEPLGSAPLTCPQTTALGTALRTLFAVPADALAAFPERISGPSSLLAQLRTRVDEPDPSDHDPLVAAALQAARSWLHDPQRDADCVAPYRPVLGLADGNLANVLYDGTACRLVDFEDAGLSDPAYELADLVEHASVRLPRLLDPERLLDVVGLDQAGLARFTTWRRLFAAFWLLRLLPDGSAHHRNPAGSLADQARHVLGQPASTSVRR